ncbi:glycosyltransferase family 4 protein [Sphingobacterium griseoflavum]|uniref:Glycosyl transferase n=1 Tax=Sphingobacterium griseoflavum TaxID=1474952 RepID=A0ABQ3I0Z1_9SPHI|nr:glycosyltransferase family 4 protein [Sphingobacterium griseoflavum]GHE39798.1 glycosyl transferase [Sphingobacterium griseoflavum]
MKIVYCIAATSNSGGMERVLANKANYFARMGFEVHIVTTDQAGKPNFFPLDPRVQQHDLGINYVHNNGRSLLYKVLSYGQKQKLHRKRLTVLLQNLKADISISMFDHEVSFLQRIPDGSIKILEIHFSRFKRLQYGRAGIWALVNQYRSKQDLRYAQQYARFVVLTHEDRGYWGDLPNIRVIPNANSFRPTTVSDRKEHKVMAVGRYDDQKCFADLIAAWATIRQVQPGWALHIYGQGPLQGKLQAQIVQLGLTGVVRLEAPVKDIESAYRQHAMLAMTSRYEGLPMALLEAQACGLPLVAYACKCGPRDIIRDGENGFLVPEGDKATLTERLLRLMEDEVLRQQMGQAAERRSLDFTEDVVMEQWLNLFSELQTAHGKQR